MAYTRYSIYAVAHKNCYNFETGLPIDVMFSSSVEFLGSADLMMQVSMTLNDSEPQFRSQYSLKANISQTLRATAK